MFSPPPPLRSVIAFESSRFGTTAIKAIVIYFSVCMFLVTLSWQLLVTLCGMATVLHSIFDLPRKLLVKKFVNVQLSLCRLAQALGVTGG
jgi:hypothetical protein